MWARAQKNRWEEELARTEREMEWSTRYFMNKRDAWYSRLIHLRRQPDETAGHAAYCEEMIFRFEEFTRLADTQYRMANTDFPPTWKPLLSPL